MHQVTLAVDWLPFCMMKEMCLGVMAACICMYMYAFRTTCLVSNIVSLPPPPLFFPRYLLHLLPWSFKQMSWARVSLRDAR